MLPTPVVCHIDRASFSIWSKHEIKKISVKKLTEPKAFEKLGVAHNEGLYSPVLGPIKHFDICGTCQLNHFDCPGHYGHIELCVPVYHPMLVQVMYQIISKCCLECYHFRLASAQLKLFLAQLEALNLGFDHLIEELDEIAGDVCRDETEGQDSYLAARLQKLLVKRIQEEREKTVDFDCEKRPQQRSIVERLSKIFRNFINGRLVKPLKMCPNCHEKKTSISLHQNSALVIGSILSKANEQKRTKSTRAKSKDLDKVYSSKHLHHLMSNDRVFLTPVGAKYYFRKIWKNEKRTMQRIFHFLNLDELVAEKKDQSFTSSGDVKEEADAEEATEEKPVDKDDFEPIDLFFIDTILVPPSKFRPPMSQRGYMFEGPRTAALGVVMKQSVVVQELLKTLNSEQDKLEKELLQPKVQAGWRELQKSVNSLYDNEMDKYNKNQYPGLKQLIDKKEGLFRKNMMGKRVNFAARSVISPDPNILVDQIGVPLVFAKKLTYPQPVTPWNIEQLRSAILNGPNEYPGAVSIVYEDGVTVSLAKENVRQQIASKLSYIPRSDRNLKRKHETYSSTIVNRHLLTGDVLLFNRQPTLHKPSIMAFRARVLPNEKGFRLHYANCKSFNADFDGDEMNAHLPQNELARSEAYNIASVNYQYLVPKDGSPLGGLIQDHVVAPCILSSRGQFYEKDQYNQLVYSSLEFLDRPLILEQPTIIKPKALWTGKQVITTIIKNCIPRGKPFPSLSIKSKIGPKILNISSKYEDLSDCHVTIRNGELLVGYMDKSNVGATQYGLVHTCYELYGGETSSNLMSAFARLSTWYLQYYEGFTLGIVDILVEPDAEQDRRNYIYESLTVGPNSAKEALGIEEEVVVDDEILEKKLRDAHSDRDPLPMKKLDAAMKSRTDKVASNISGRCLPKGLIRKFPDNNLQMMIQSGAKGGTVNALQISCLLGQIELEGRRVPLSMSGRSLPSFKPYDTSPKAGGFVSGRFLTGIQPQEFFFHCMAGREGLIDTAVKTSRSGYLQRCLIKHLEGLTVHYDQTVRDSCGSVIQFLYGEDGLDITKSQMLKQKAFSSLVDNYKIICPSEEELRVINKSKEGYEADVIARIDDIQQWVMRNGDDKIKKARGSGFLDFLESKLNDLEAQQNLTGGSASGFQQAQPKEEIVPCVDVKLENPSQTKLDTQAVYGATSIGSGVKNVNPTPIIGSDLHDQVFMSWFALSFKEKRKWHKAWELCPDPLTASMNPASHFGVVPEKLDETIEDFARKNPNLIVDSASLVSADGTGDASLMYDYSALDENPEISKSILTHLNQTVSSQSAKLTKHEFYNLCYSLYMKMLAHPGESVGLLAAQSIGEPSTQMTLNTFHFAGRGEMNVTLGIPRLREILMTASAKIGTPSMDLPLLKVMRDEAGNEMDEAAMEEQARQAKLALNAVRLSDVLEYVDITEQVVKHAAGEAVQEIKSGSRKRPAQKSTARPETDQSMRYELTFVVLPSKYYKHEFRSSSSIIMKFIEEVFITQLTDAMIKRIKRLLMADDLYDLSTRKLSERKVTASNDTGKDDVEEQELEDFNARARAKEKQRGDESSSEEEEEGGGDGTAQKVKSRQNQDLDYEEPEDDDFKVDGGDAIAANDEENDDEFLMDEDEKAKLQERDTPGISPDLNEEEKSKEEAKGSPDEPPPAKKRPAVDCDRIQQVKMKPYVVDYEYDAKRQRWCKLTICMDLTTTRLDMGALVMSEAKRTYVHQVGNIQRALIVKDVNAKSRGARCDKMIKTEGVSLLSLVRYNHILDLNAIYSNDIHAIANTYGIEAASQAIRREMANVFAVYGIEVDSRHLSLIADYMTYNGSIRGMNRMSMEASASPFQQMSYESTLRYLKWAAIMGLYDDIRSPSAALVFGRTPKGGTGSFSLLADAKA